MVELFGLGFFFCFFFSLLSVRFHWLSQTNWGADESFILYLTLELFIFCIPLVLYLKKKEKRNCSVLALSFFVFFRSLSLCCCLLGFLSRRCTDWRSASSVSSPLFDLGFDFFFFHFLSLPLLPLLLLLPRLRLPLFFVSVQELFLKTINMNNDKNKY